MSSTRQPKGPTSYRFLVTSLNVLLAILFYWLLGFVLQDISNQPGPSWETIQTHYQDPVLIKQKAALTQQDQTLSQEMNTIHKQQELLQTSINSYRDTMNQLLDLQKSNTQKNTTTTAETQQNLANATKLFLENQQRFQALNSTASQTNDTLQQVRNKTEKINNQLSEQTERGNKEYNSQLQSHNIKVALLQLALLIPLLLITAYFFKQYRLTIYKSMIIAVGVALILKIVMVMHEHFPSRAFKYIFILVLIVLVIRTLKNLLRMMLSPKSNWLQKQYREAYKKMQCPVCEYAIRPGVLKYATLEKNIRLSDNLPNIETYSCPSCGVHLFEKCSQCGNSRHSLLPFCETCGKEL